MVKRKGWEREPARHSLAARGVPSTAAAGKTDKLAKWVRLGEEYTQFVCPQCGADDYDLFFIEPYRILWTEPPRPKPYLAMGFKCRCGKTGEFNELVEEERRG